MEDERKKSLAPPNVALRAEVLFMANRPRKVNVPLKTLDLGKELPRSKRLREIETRI